MMTASASLGVMSWLRRRGASSGAKVILVALLGATLLMPLVSWATPPAIPIPPGPARTMTGNATPPALAGCGSSVYNLLTFSFSCIIADIFALFFRLAGSILWMTALFLDLTIRWTVLQVGMLIAPNGTLLPGILFAWTILRDVSNLFFLFGLILIGISTILGISQWGYRQLLVRLLVAAILINFSLLFARLGIDISNLLAISAYNNITSIPPPGVDFTERVFASSWVQSLYNPTGPNGLFANATQGTWATLWNVVLASVLGIILFTIMGFVFIAMALMLVVRLIILIFLMIVSPIAFSASVLPWTANIARKWWDSFLKNLLLGPALMITTFVAMVVTNGVGNSLISSGGGNTSFSGLVSGIGGSAILILNFAIMAGFYIAALVISSNLGSTVAKGAITRGGRWSRAATMRTVGFMGRNTLGRAGAAIASSENVKGAAAQSGWRGMAGRAALRVGGATAGTSFGGAKGGYAGVQKRRAERAEALGREIGKASATASERVALNAQYAERTTKLNQLAGLQARYEQARASGDVAGAAAAKRAVGDANTELKKIEETIKGINDGVSARGNARRAQYADTLTAQTRWSGLHEVAGTQGAYEAAARSLRSGQTPLSRLQDLVKDLEASTPQQTASSTAPQAGGTTTP